MHNFVKAKPIQNDLESRNLEQIQEDSRNSKKVDTKGSFFNPQQNYQKIIQSNRLKVLEKALHELNQENVNFDPIRNKLRVIPITKVHPLAKEFIFVKAGMHCLQNNLNQAMKLLNIGLLLCNKSPLYTFTHGVIMFKLGSLRRALEDFNDVHLKDETNILALFNLGLTHFQLGSYEEAISSFSKIIAIHLEQQMTAARQNQQSYYPKPQEIETNLLFDTHVIKA